MSAYQGSECDSVPLVDSEGPQFDMHVTPGSRHHTLLTTNEIPDPSDIPLIQKAVVECAARLAYLDHQLSRLVQEIMSKSGSHSTYRLESQILDPESSLLRDQMVKWKEERSLLLDYLAQNKAISSPLRRMPPEVLGEIFLLTLPSRIQESSLISVVHGSPWVLTRVCSRWREIGTLTPSLWSRIAIDYYKKTIYSIPRIQTQMQRANMLRIYFYGSTKFDTGHQLQMLKCLAEHSSRWTELSIGVTKKMLPVLAELRDRLPALRRVWIQWEQESARRTRIGCFQTAPSLRDITIFNDSPSQVGILLPAQQLTRYDADGPWEMHWTFLTSESAQSLVEVRIETDVPVYSGQVIELLHLQRLFVSRIDVLDNLKAPALEEIAFNLGDGSRAWDRGNLDPFVARSACTLRRLSVRSLQGREVFPILGVLRKYPSITSLAILTPNPNAILPHLTILNPTAGTAVSPQLSEIYIGTPAHIDWARYIEMLDSRWKVEGCALRSAVVAVIGSPPRSTELSRLGALRKDGLDLTLLKGEDADDAMRAWMYIPKWT